MKELHYKVMAKDVMGAKEVAMGRLASVSDSGSGLDLTWDVLAVDREGAIAMAKQELERIQGHSRTFLIVEIEGMEPLPHDSKCVLQLVRP